MSRKRPVIHIRRCHVCGAVTEQEERISRCEYCGKCVVPFLYYDDTKVEPFAEDQPRFQSQSGQMRPIIGLTAYW